LEIARKEVWVVLRKFHPRAGGNAANGLEHLEPQSELLVRPD